jgi:hypothetical protein
MINDIGNILKPYIESLSFADKVGGVVKVATKTDTDSNDRTVKKYFPIDCGVTHQECISGKYTDLMPNSNYKSVMYFEDGGIRFIGNNIREASLKLVGWLNLKKLGKTGCNGSALAVNTILNTLPTKYFNSPPVYQRIKIEVQGEDVKSSQIFSKYSYDEDKTQFLMYPYDYFALNINVLFSISKACIVNWDVSPELECNG